eukprot:scaffold167647_cov31-Attheya_sp.AAC.2
MEMTRNGYRFNLEGWSLSRVAMVVFGSGSTVALHPIWFFFAQEGDFYVEHKGQRLPYLVYGLGAPARTGTECYARLPEKVMIFARLKLSDNVLSNNVTGTSRLYVRAVQ